MNISPVSHDFLLLILHYREAAEACFGESAVAEAGAVGVGAWMTRWLRCSQGRGAARGQVAADWVVLFAEASVAALTPPLLRPLAGATIKRAEGELGGI